MLSITGTASTAKQAATSRLADHFRLAERNTTLRTEVIGGLTTFAVMAYIIFLNPFILTLNGAAQAPKVAPFAGLVTATCLAAAIMTIAMGWFTNYPFALAPGLGINTVLAFDLIANHNVSWQAAMGVIFVGGVLITALVLAGFGEALLRAIPLALKRAIGVGIGIFILFIGLFNAGVVRVPIETITISGAASITGPTTLGSLAAESVRLGAPGTPVTLGTLTRLPVALAILGLLLTLGLMVRGVKAALLYGIIATTAVAIAVKWIAPELTVSSASSAADLRHLTFVPLDISTIGAGFNLTAFNSPTAAAKGLGFLAALLVMFSLTLSGFLDTVGTIVGVGEKAGLVDHHGQLPDTHRVLVIDSLATALGGLFGVSSVTTYVESAAGVTAGARTGLSSLVTGLCFILALGLAPIAGLVPPEATAPALIIVGFFMFAAVREIDFSSLLEGFPALITLIMIPLTYSITNGIGAGFITYTFLHAVSGRGREAPPLAWAISAGFVVYFLLPLV